ncbi:hypothetical protein [Conexibacter woesei]|uniref:Uncharacterized protein n=1 Tax=Conexibacter woesei (strain DSM 14684 / CCUG 47730 / CIP 108061 / JCM 11494 / NBRC 100937 / ID131577) TaxID=469383 RepID=D3EZS8_CONWI|nr:hypothetical protein [Conexibacter woesei]ADB53916.1 hypothetical protein Cwoe_5511 [Conexibacter woesei DSM 14684]
MSKPKILIALVVLSGLLAAPALAASPDSIIKDCSSSPTGELQKQYSNGDLRKALKEVNGDVAEYTNCYDAIRNAMRDGSRRGDDGGDGDGTSPGGDPGTGGTGGGSGGGGLGSTGGGGVDGGDGSGGGTPAGGPAPAPVTPQPGSGEPVKLAGTTVTPSIPATLERNGHELPPALIGFLALFGAGAVGVAATTIGRRVLARRRI